MLCTRRTVPKREGTGALSGYGCRTGARVSALTTGGEIAGVHCPVFTCRVRKTAGKEELNLISYYDIYSFSPFMKTNGTNKDSLADFSTDGRVLLLALMAVVVNNRDSGRLRSSG